MTTRKHSVEKLASRIRKRPYSIISNNCLIKSVEFARRCTRMGVEAKVVPCLAFSHRRIPIVGFKVPIAGPHFYAEVLGKRYEVSREPNDENHSEPKVLVKLGRFKPFVKE